MQFWQHLVPHRRNRFHPSVLRWPVLLSVGILILLLILPTTGWRAEGAVLGYATNISVGELHSISNQQRSQNGLGGYQLNSKLSQAAAAKAQHMFAKNYWAHTAPDGTTPWSFISASGYSYTLAGENLAKDFSTSAGVVSGWMGSSGHRANVLSTRFRDVGYAAVNGTLQGKKTTLVVAMYAQPAASAPASKPSTTTAKPAPSSATRSTAPSSSPAKPAAEQPKAATKPKPATPKPVTIQPLPDERPYTTELSGQVLNEQSSLLAAPTTMYQRLTWQERLAVVLICYFSLLYVLKHTLVWRHNKRGRRHILLRYHPLAQAALLFMAVLALLASSAGVVL